MAGKILLVMDETERGKIAFQKMLRFAELGLRGDIYLLFVKEMEIPPMVSEEKEISAYQRIMTETMNKLESYKKKLEEVGFKVTDVQVTFGKFADRILILEGMIKPEIIVIGTKQSSISRFFGKDPAELLLRKSRATIIICRD